MDMQLAAPLDTSQFVLGKSKSKIVPAFFCEVLLLSTQDIFVVENIEI